MTSALHLVTINLASYEFKFKHILDENS